MENPGPDDDQLVDPNDQGGAADPPASQPTSVEPDAAYKGLQRVLAKEQAARRELEARIQAIQSQPANQQNDQIIGSLIQEIAQNDPARAQALAQNYQTYRVQTENQQLRMQSAQVEAERAIAAADARNVEELRAIVADLGADPDSPSIDYGDPNEWFAERITKARESAKAAAKQAKTVTPPNRTVADGTAHNTQPGTPPQAARTGNRNQPVTEDMVQAAQAEYARAFIAGGPARAAAEAKMNELNARLAEQLFA